MHGTWLKTKKYQTVILAPVRKYANYHTLVLSVVYEFLYIYIAWFERCMHWNRRAAGSSLVEGLKLHFSQLVPVRSKIVYKSSLISTYILSTFSYTVSNEMSKNLDIGTQIRKIPIVHVCLALFLERGLVPFC